MADASTLQFYAANAVTYVRHGDNQPGEQLLAFIRALPLGGRVLELGAGSGRDAAHMLAQGLAVDATDASPDLAAEASKRLGRPVRQMQFNELDAEAEYDAVWASASLLHAPAAELTEDLARIYRALRPSGLFVASFKAGSGEGRDTFGRYYNYPDADTLRAHYQAAATWADLTLVSVMGSGYDNVPTPWLWMTARK